MGNPLAPLIRSPHAAALAARCTCRGRVRRARLPPAVLRARRPRSSRPYPANRAHVSTRPSSRRPNPPLRTDEEPPVHIRRDRRAAYRSRNLEKANNWTAEKMKAYGLKNVRLEPWEIRWAGARRATMKLVEPDNGRELLIASARWTPGTRSKVTGPSSSSRRNKGRPSAVQGKLKNAVILSNPPANVKPVTDLSYPAVRGAEERSAEEGRDQEGRTEGGAADLVPATRRRRGPEFLKAEGSRACVPTRPSRTACSSPPAAGPRTAPRPRRGCRACSWPTSITRCSTASRRARTRRRGWKSRSTTSSCRGR